jgi:hypothetical protein
MAPHSSTRFFACGDLLEHLKKDSTGLQALDIVALHLNMLLLYKIAASMMPSSWPWKKCRIKQSALNSPSWTLNWPCTLPPLCSSQAITRKRWMNGKDATLPRKPGPNGSKSTWLHTPGASATNTQGQCRLQASLHGIMES